MTTPPTGTQFKKKPPRKGDRGKRVSVSLEARQAYEDEIKARTEREAYLRHLGGNDRDRR